MQRAMCTFNGTGHRYISNSRFIRFFYPAARLVAKASRADLLLACCSGCLLKKKHLVDFFWARWCMKRWVGTLPSPLVIVTQPQVKCIIPHVPCIYVVPVDKRASGGRNCIVFPGGRYPVVACFSSTDSLDNSIAYCLPTWMLGYQLTNVRQKQPRIKRLAVRLF